MGWTPAQIGTAWSEISPTPASLNAGLAQVQAYVVTLTNQPVSWHSVKLIARTSTTGDWGRVLARSDQTPALPPTTSVDAAILAAKNAVSMQDTDMVDPTNTTHWDAFQAGLSTLEASGDLSSATVAAINALTSVTTTPLAGVQLYDLQGAQAAGFIPSTVPVA
ncbi:MAG: hypothetical protein HIU82_02065 [Proteobacteria bacterium]|nr:hypothetical protein [Pseudomonadota bacterium]